MFIFFYLYFVCVVCMCVCMCSDQIYEESIQELNNLIGELDTFQREHDRQHSKTSDSLYDDTLSMASSSCMDPDQYFRENSEVIVLRSNSRDSSTRDLNGSLNSLTICETPQQQQPQRLSSFKSFEYDRNFNNIEQKSPSPSLSQKLYDERVRPKPILLPRPASVNSTSSAGWF